MLRIIGNKGTRQDVSGWSGRLQTMSFRKCDQKQKWRAPRKKRDTSIPIAHKSSLQAKPSCSLTCLQQKASYQQDHAQASLDANLGIVCLPLAGTLGSLSTPSSHTGTSFDAAKLLSRLLSGNTVSDPKHRQCCRV